MSDIEREIRLKFFHELCGLSSIMIRRMPPFDNPWWEKQVRGPEIVRFHKYKEVIDLDKREELLDCIVQGVHALLYERIVGGSSEKAGVLSAQCADQLNSFNKWVLDIESQDTFLPNALDKFPSPYPLLKEIMEGRRPEYKKDATLKDNELWAFSRPNKNETKYFIVFGKFRIKPYFSILLGYVDKRYNLRLLLDASEFYGGASSFYLFETQEDIAAHINSALDYIDLFMPHFEERIEKVIAWADETYGKK